MHHPHLHCVVPAGGISLDGARWVSCRPGFFLSVRVLSRLFRRLFLERLQSAFDSKKLKFFFALERFRDRREFLSYLYPLSKSEWVVYAKPPFAGPEKVLDYVGRYTHRVAISNNRLLDIEDGQVSFRYKDYKDRSQQKTMSLSAEEFIVASSSMFCHVGFIVSVTSASSAIAIAKKNWTNAVNCSAWLFRNCLQTHLPPRITVIGTKH